MKEITKLIKSAGDKPWYNLEVMVELFSSPVVNTDEEASAFYNELGYEVSRRAVTDARNSLGIPAKSKASLFHVEKDDIDEVKADRDRIWKLAFDMQQELRKENHAKKDIAVNLVDDGPIGISFMGDLHIGDVGTDHNALIRDVELVQSTDHLFVTLGGDYINNFIKGGKKIKNHEVMPIEFAWMLTEDLFERLKDSLWAILIGNHDAWTDQAAEFDKLGEMVNRLGVPYGKHGCNLHVKFPDGQQYKIRLRHKYRFESQQNLMNAVKQMYRFEEPFDIGVLHHLHSPNNEMWLQHGKPTYAIRPGSYKVEDDYSYESGFTTTGFGMSKRFGTDESCEYSIPTAILWPKERRINVFSTIKDGVEYLNFARQEYKKGRMI